MTMEQTTDQTNLDGTASELSDVLGGFVKDAWVADFVDPERPRIARVQEAYESFGEVVLDLVLYRRDGTKLGRVSPACGGPRGFEPACPADAWEPIEEPDFDYLAEPRYHWGDRVRRIKTPNVSLEQTSTASQELGCVPRGSRSTG
jgi:hypothetical protein